MCRTQMLSNNTRKTKVVELSSGTHRSAAAKRLRHASNSASESLAHPCCCRVPDELKKHYLSDGEGGQYLTNLDRNRYGNDENYLFTGANEMPCSYLRVQLRPSRWPLNALAVIRYDLEFLNLCPCLVDVEIVDNKAGQASTVVESGAQACTCGGKVGREAGDEAVA